MRMGSSEVVFKIVRVEIRLDYVEFCVKNLCEKFFVNTSQIFKQHIHVSVLCLQILNVKCNI